jgi:outer membrane scaffolding protein for murein synthesis (MipA/OmpV family)
MNSLSLKIVPARAGLAGLLLLASAVGPGRCEDLPLCEAGIGIAGISSPSYRGASDVRYYPLPLPYAIYRGRILKADRDGVRGVFVDTEQVKLNTSLTASLPVSGDDYAPRRGMPDLKPTVEVGPSLDLRLWRSPDRRRQLDLRLPLRFGLTVESSPRTIGWAFSPRLNLDLRDPLGLTDWNLGLLAGPIFGSRRYHDYFYSVDPAYATPDRPAYEAEAGYAGLQLIAAVSRRFPSYWVGAFVRYDSLQGAVFEDSPLVQSDHYLAVGLGIAWVLGESSTRVQED